MAGGGVADAGREGAPRSSDASHESFPRWPRGRDPRASPTGRIWTRTLQVVQGISEPNSTSARFALSAPSGHAASPTRCTESSPGGGKAPPGVHRPRLMRHPDPAAAFSGFAARASGPPTRASTAREVLSVLLEGRSRPPGRALGARAREAPLPSGGTESSTGATHASYPPIRWPTSSPVRTCASPPTFQELRRRSRGRPLRRPARSCGSRAHRRRALPGQSEDDGSSSLDPAARGRSRTRGREGGLREWAPSYGARLAAAAKWVASVVRSRLLMVIRTS